MTGHTLRIVAITMMMVTASCLLPNTSANAADYETPSWDGFYVGAHAGYGWFDMETGSGAPYLDASGPIGGVLVGYNWDIASYVLGLEADAAFGAQDDKVAQLGGGTLKLTNHGQHTFRVRTGAKLGNDGLLYATAGLALADYWAKANPGQQDKNFLLGGVVGAGYEIKVTQDVIMRGEYLYANYGSQTFNTGVPTSIDVDTLTFHFGLGWLF